jgi:hypothetical protein
MRNEECVLGLAKRDKYIVFQKYVVSIIMKRHIFLLFFCQKKKKIKRNSFVSVMRK